MGALALAIGYMNYQKVSGMQFEAGGGGSPGGAIGTFNANPGTGLPESQSTSSGFSSTEAPGQTLQSEQQLAPRTVNVVLRGEGAPSDQYIREVLIPGLNDAIGDGVELKTMAA
jgi:hypothetical protein